MEMGWRSSSERVRVKIVKMLVRLVRRKTASGGSCEEYRKGSEFLKTEDGLVSYAKP